MAFHTNISVDAVNPLAFELVNACLNDNNKIATLYENLQDLDLNLLEKQIERSIDFVLSVISPITLFKSNKRNGKNKIYHSKFQIMSMISTTFKEMYRQGEKTISESWKEKEKILQKNLIQYYIYDILTDWWSEGGTGKIYTVAKPNRYMSEISPQTWAVALNGYFEKTIQRCESDKIATVKSEEYVLMNAIYMNTFTALDQLSVNHFDVEHIAPKKQMQNLIKNCNVIDAGLPISCIANLCYLPEAANRSKGALNFYQDKKYLKGENIEDIEAKYSFTSEEDLEWMDKPYDSESDFKLLKEEYIGFLRNRFDIIKHRFCESLGIQYTELNMDEVLDFHKDEVPDITNNELSKREIRNLPYLKKLEKSIESELIRLKGNIYYSKNKHKGFSLSISKDYHQGNRSKYWFVYRKKDSMDAYEEKYFVYGCESPNTMLCLPKDVIESYLDNLNKSYDEDGEVTHWHIVIFKDEKGKLTLLLSRPEIIEIDITKYLI